MNANASEIFDVNVTDRRPISRLNNDLIPLIGNNQIADGAVTAAKMDDTGWVSLGHASGWKNPGFGYEPSYRRIGDIVFLRGSTQKNAGNLENGNVPLPTLPVQIRPSAVMYFQCRTSAGYTVSLQINADGTSSIATGGYSTGVYISFDNVSYALD